MTGFNEAGAVKPRKREAWERPPRVGARFNEAGAVKPRKLHCEALELAGRRVLQ